MPYTIPKIKTRTELKELFEELAKQGFSYHRPLDAHNQKIYLMVSAVNKLNLDFPSDLPEKLWKESKDSYENLEMLAQKHFSKFNVADRVKQLLNSNYPIKWNEVRINKSNEAIRKNPPAELIGYSLSMKEGENEYWHLYDLSGKTLRLKYDFKTLPELLRKTIEPNFEFSTSENGEWKTSGNSQYKVFQNGTIAIKHPRIDVLKELYRSALLKRSGSAVKM